MTDEHSKTVSDDALDELRLLDRTYHEALDRLGAADIAVLKAEAMRTAARQAAAQRDQELNAATGRALAKIGMTGGTVDLETGSVTP